VTRLHAIDHPGRADTSGRNVDAHAVSVTVDIVRVVADDDGSGQGQSTPSRRTIWIGVIAVLAVLLAGLVGSWTSPRETAKNVVPTSAVTVAGR